MHEILKKLLPVIGQQISQAWGVKDDLKKLGETLESIQALISDAEEKQITDATVRLWLRRLKDVVYDADDVMEKFCYQTMRRRERGSQLKRKVRDVISKSSNPLGFNKKMAGKIRAIKKRLDEIYNEKVRYTLGSTGGTSQVDLTREHRKRLTTSVANYSDLLGREGASSEVVKMLTNRTLPSVSPSSSSHNNSSLSVISIVGMGGLGKTSLAQLVYKDESIKTHFEKKIWVCISDNFDVSRILKQILESLTGGSCGDISNIDVLARQIKEELAGKKYLLVLDDLWSEDAEEWEKLQGVLVNGVEGSNILVTTRSQKVASVVGGKVYNLQKLTDDVCWSIMQKRISYRGGAVLTQNMSNIGRAIARKCDGLPLAANILGSLLSLKKDESYWVSINEDKSLWVQPGNAKVISILKLSYDNLPSPLKQCFSYCCLFPKDWEIERKKLIWLWIAEGFIQSSEVSNYRSLEDIGNDYFEYLLFNSFFQDIKQDGFGDIANCKMHDLVHDLAMSVVDPNEFGTDVKGDVSQVRRLQLICHSDSSTTTARVLREARKLRTIFVLGRLQMSSLLPTKRLRVLYPLRSGYSELSLTSIPKFKHLRFLDLSYCVLPHDPSLYHSYNLQTLILRECENVSVFLGVFGQLKNLRHLDVSKSDIKGLPDDSIANLADLQTLDLSDCEEFAALPENIGLLKHLSHLDLSSSSIRNIPDSITCISSLVTLEFRNCTNLDALPTELGSLTRLRCLDLLYTEIKVLPESCIRNLCNLEIVKFGTGCELPKEIKNWPKLRVFEHWREYSGDIMPRGMENLTCLEMLESYVVRKEATDIQERGHSGHSGLEELAALNSLQVLCIKSLENVRGGREDAERAKLMDKSELRVLYLGWGSSGDEYDDSVLDDDDEYEDDGMALEGLRPHPNLRELRIRGFSGLNLPKWMGSSSSLPNLVELNLENCNSCEKLPALGGLPCLRNLYIEGMHSVKCLGKEFYYQQESRRMGNLKGITSTSSSLFPSLVYLNIDSMDNLEEWVSPPPSSSYNYVDSFPLLEKLYIQNCPKLRSAPKSFPSLEELELWDTNGKAVNSILSSGGCLTSLTSILIMRSPELIYFPLGALLRDTNLHSLEITQCSGFQGFREDDGDLTNSNNSTSSLHKLALYSCPVLTSLPYLRLWTSLRELTIVECEKLKESIPYDFKASLSFLDSLKVDFIQREDPQLPNPEGDLYPNALIPSKLINLMKM